MAEQRRVEEAKQLQAEEIEVLRSIFADEFELLADESTLTACKSADGERLRLRLQIRVQLNGPLRLEVALNDSRVESFVVHFVPPLRLEVELPEEYPLAAAPLFTLESCWLHAPHLSRLCTRLDELWQTYEGSAVLYAWADWLRSSALSYLGADESIQLEAGGRSSAELDNRAFSTFESLAGDLVHLLQFDKEQRLAAFRSSQQTCSICENELAGSAMIVLGCSHRFCGECLGSLIRVAMNENRVQRTECPQRTCRQPIEPQFVRRLLTAAEFERWEQLLLSRTLDRMLTHECPRCAYPSAFQEQAGDDLVRCGQCLFCFCVRCRAAYHQGVDCAGEVLSAPAEEPTEERLGLIRCPHCSLIFEKNGGCNKLTCPKCGSFICYLCGRVIQGYNHFGSACVLFEEPKFHGSIESRGGVQQFKADQLDELHFESHSGGLTKKCPSCGQQLHRRGSNNHVRCWQCRKAMCFQCGQSVGGTLHFGVGRCRQHAGSS